MKENGESEEVRRKRMEEVRRRMMGEDGCGRLQGY